MTETFSNVFKHLAIAGAAGVFLVGWASIVRGQVLRGPDLGVWFVQQRDPRGARSLVVVDLVAEGAFAAAGLREGDRILSVDGRSIETERKFAEAFLVPTHPSVNVIVAREGTQQTLTLKPAAVLDGMVAPDPLYLAGLIVEPRDTDSSSVDSLSVERVFPCTPAFYAGVRQADVITSVNGHQVSLLATLKQLLRSGDDVRLVVRRAVHTQELTQTRELIMYPTLHRELPPRRTTARALPPSGDQLSRPQIPLREPPTQPPLFIPRSLPSVPPVLPGPPPPLPVLPPPGTVLNPPGV